MPVSTIGPFKLEYFQVLNEKGEIDKKLDPGLSNEELLKLYRAMVLGRETDERLLKLQRQGRLGTLPVCFGQEAASAGAVMAMKDSDWFVGAYRELSGRLMRGESIENPMLIYNGLEEGNMIKTSPRTLPIAIVLASQIPQAVGLGYSIKMKQEKDTAVVTFFGDGSTSEGDFHEAMNFASVWKVPVVFLCQNNSWAISTPLKKQMASETIAQKAIAYNMPSVQVDGNDALAVYKATREAIDRAYAGEGPSFIEAVTYRMNVHTTADDPTKYRKDDEVAMWAEKDPITRFRAYLGKKKIWNDEKEDALRKEIRDEIAAAVKNYEEPRQYKPDAPFDFIYGTEVEAIEEQRAEFLENFKKDVTNG
ncbi:pyruvate dehydrogenase (acetyl-transferring) E1 component subunit alpha [bacterium]|nr:pyruvate dehydrogenase (acetyl-transferring) E1 component subunit alpha [bacterium]